MNILPKTHIPITPAPTPLCGKKNSNNSWKKKVQIIFLRLVCKNKYTRNSIYNQLVKYCDRNVKWADSQLLVDENQDEEE